MDDSPSARHDRNAGDAAEHAQQMDPPEAIDRARKAIADARRVVVLTGAGISTDSGIPDFRGPQGVWTKDPGAERLANIDAYMSDRELRKRAWHHRVESSRSGAEPNRGHTALVELERQGRLHTLVTQNVDGLHHKAGSDPEKVVEIHGTMRDVVCMRCGWRAPADATLDRVRAGEDDPRCLEVRPSSAAGGDTCGGILKSATISFGQNLVPEDLDRAQAAAAETDLLLAVGSSLGVYPAAGLVPIAASVNATIIIVNAQHTDFDPIAEVVLRGPISEVLPRIVSG